MLGVVPIDPRTPSQMFVRRAVKQIARQYSVTTINHPGWRVLPGLALVRVIKAQNSARGWCSHKGNSRALGGVR